MFTILSITLAPLVLAYLTAAVVVAHSNPAIGVNE